MLDSQLLSFAVHSSLPFLHSLPAPEPVPLLFITLVKQFSGQEPEREFEPDQMPGLEYMNFALRRKLSGFLTDSGRFTRGGLNARF